jgi:hypothetical protein
MRSWVWGVFHFHFHGVLRASVLVFLFLFLFAVSISVLQTPNLKLQASEFQQEKHSNTSFAATSCHIPNQMRTTTAQFASVDS